MDPILKLSELEPLTSDHNICLDHFSVRNRYVFVINCKRTVPTDNNNVIDDCYVMFYDTNFNFVSHIRLMFYVNRPTRIASFADKIFVCEFGNNDTLFFLIVSENKSYDEGMTSMGECQPDEIRFKERDDYFYVYGPTNYVIAFYDIHDSCSVVMDYSGFYEQTVDQDLLS